MIITETRKLNSPALGLNNGKSSHGATTVGLVVHLGGTLEETRVEVENVTGVGLTTGGTTEKERHLTVGNSLLGKIVEDTANLLVPQLGVFDRI